MKRQGLEAVASLRLADAVSSSDVVVLGSGVAGLSAALSLAPRRVTLLSKGRLASGSSRWAQGGIAAAMSARDDPASHAADTLAAGAGLCDEGLVARLTAEGPQSIRRLIERGVRFDRDAAGRLRLGREGAHSASRIVHAGGDATGAELVRALIEKLLEAQCQDGKLDIREHAFAEDLVIEDGRVVGVLARDAGGCCVLHRSRAVVLATGGCGQLWAKTTNPVEVTGDGLAMAGRAGAVLADLAFMQFHPTALDAVMHGDGCRGVSLPLLTEVLRGEGAVLVDEGGERFMLALDRRAELAPRDIVARAIWRKKASGQGVWLDARKAVGAAFPERFPTVWAHCRQQGLDPRVQALPVTPAAHYAMAGVAVDEAGRTSLDGLWACGEVAASGLHGANRLASNSLLEGIVFGARVAADIAGCTHAASRGGMVQRQPARDGWTSSAKAQAPVREVLRALAWRSLGLERTRQGLGQALLELDRLASELPSRPTETANLVTVGRMVATAALAREESRGAHWRTDFPRAREAWAHRAFWTYTPGSDSLLLSAAHRPGARECLEEIA